MELTCPWCDSTRLYAEEVDIGVGFQRVTPWQCMDCDAREFYSSEDREHASPQECAVGWFAPIDHPHSSITWPCDKSDPTSIPS